MNLFDALTTEAIKNQPQLSLLRIVVEKELLHHDILRIMAKHHLLNELTFIGGTCLRACYGGIRLSEDLDFTSGKQFTCQQLSDMSHIIIKTLKEKYDLNVEVTKPKKDSGNVDTWKIKIITHPEQKHIPAQRINIDICSVPSYEKQAMLLINPYGIDMGTHGLVIQAQSREEIYADKILAFALHPNRLKHRDLWDMIWLHQQNITPKLSLVPHKLKDRDLTLTTFISLFEKRYQSLTKDTTLAPSFSKEMHRFLPSEQIKKIIEQNNLWEAIVYLIGDLKKQLEALKT